MGKSINNFVICLVQSEGWRRGPELDCGQPPAAAGPRLEPRGGVAVLRPRPPAGSDQARHHLQVHHRGLRGGEDGRDPGQEAEPHLRGLPLPGRHTPPQEGRGHHEYFRTLME